MKHSNPRQIANDILNLRGEDDIAFLFGKRRNEIEYMKLEKPKTSGIIGRVLAFIYFLFRNFGLKVPKRHSNAEIFIYAGSNNQLVSMLPSIQEIHQKNLPYVLYISKGVSKDLLNEVNYVDLKFSPKVIFGAILMMTVRGVGLYRKLLKQNMTIEAKWHFNEFLRSYPYLLAFATLMGNMKPKLYLTSNDHNVPNRSALFVANYLGIKTMYMQHASVSFLFPPLEFDFALLDGEEALKTYEACVGFKPIEQYKKKNIKGCTILLSGQKKTVRINKVFDKNQRVFGIAVNSLDDFDHVKSVIERITNQGFKVVLRTHPYQKQSFINNLKILLAENNNLAWSKSRNDSLVSFFSSIDVLVAGNSSIHLEAAIAGIRTLYLEMSKDVLLPDYYGYVKLGLSEPLSRKFDARNVLDSVNNRNSKRDQAVRNFSATFGTKWQFNEGLLVALILEKILACKPLNDTFEFQKSDNYGSVGYLK